MIRKLEAGERSDVKVNMNKAITFACVTDVLAQQGSTKINPAAPAKTVVEIIHGSEVHFKSFREGCASNLDRGHSKRRVQSNRERTRYE